MKSHYERLLEARTELSEVTEDAEQALIKKINDEYEEATGARISCFCVFIFGLFFIGFVLGTLFGKPFLDWGSNLIR
jgi:hypothetical protein